MIEIAVTLAVVVTGLVLFYSRQKLNYWQSRGVDVPPYNLIIGHIYNLYFKHHRWEYVDKCYHQYKEKKFWGMYEFPAKNLYLVDREVIKNVLVKDADHFIDRRSIHTYKTGSDLDMISSEMLVNLKGEQWKNLRAVLSPTFTSGRIKAMFSLICAKADNLVSFLEEQNAKYSFVEVRDAMGKYTMSVIAICAFGIELPISEQNTEFTDKAACIMKMKLTVMVTMKFLLLSILPGKICKMLGLQFSHKDALYFKEAVEQTINARKEAGMKREDFLDLLQDALKECQESDAPKYPMTMRTVVAQSLLFLFAGFDTTSNSLGFAAYLLGANQIAQTKLREELEKIILSDGQFTYQNIMEAQYLDACFAETLRMYGPAYVLERKCTKTYRIPDSELVLEEGTFVSIPNWSLCYDSEYWENPRKFIPERFLPENKDKIKPYSYLPFGLGPRNCIAMRFAQMEAKVALAKMVLNHRITLPPGHEELVLNREALSLKATDHGIRINFETIEH